MKTIVTLLLLAGTATAADYPVVAVRLPWDGVTPQTWPAATNPLTLRVEDGKPQTGSDLVLIKPDGTRELLVDSGETGAIFDPNLDEAAEWVFYAKRPGLAGNWDIYKLNLATREEVRITGPNQGNNVAPCVIGKQLTFSSDRDGFRNNGSFVGDRHQTLFLLFAADLDGKNVERIDATDLGSALHAEPYVHGTHVKLIYSTGEGMGGRSALNWALRASNRDGTGFEPFISSYAHAAAHHFHTQIPGTSRIASTAYYNPRNGVGTLYAFEPYPQGSPAAPPRFVSPHKTALAGVSGDEFSQEFMTAGGLGLTPFTHRHDTFASQIGGVLQGFVGHPSGAPDGLLLTWTGTDTPLNPQNWKAFQTRGRIALLAGAQPVANSSGLQVIADDPEWSYLQPRAVVAKPSTELPPWNPNDGTKCPAYLPKGTPFALIGASSTLHREWLPWVFDPLGGQIPETVTDDDIHYVSLYLGRPSPRTGPAFQAFTGKERLELLADIPIRHLRTDGTSPVDGQGKPDTSWLAKIPADTPIIQAVKNANKETIAFGRTWKGFRPGEVRADCGGCHAHTVAAVPFETTLAYRHLKGELRPDDPPFVVADATKAKVMQLERDVQPILSSLGLTASVFRDNHHTLEGVPGFNTLPGRSLRSPLYTGFAGPQEQRATVRDWIETGAPEGPGILVDDLHPVLTVQEPNREQDKPITAIRFGAYDVHTGVSQVSVKASFLINGRQAGAELADLFAVQDHVWTLAIPSQAIGEVTVKVTDAAGNSESMTRTFVTTEPGNPLEQENAELRAEVQRLQGKIEAAKAALE